jgi:hypothetical protein
MEKRELCFLQTCKFWILNCIPSDQTIHPNPFTVRVCNHDNYKCMKQCYAWNCKISIHLRMTRLYMEDQGTGIHVLVLCESKLNIQCIFIFNKSSNTSLGIPWNTLNQHDILVSHILSSWERILIIVLHFQRKWHINFHPTLVQYHIVLHFF